MCSVWVGKKCLQCCSQGGRVVGRGEEPVDAVLYNFGRSARPGGNHRSAGQHALHNDASERLSAGGGVDDNVDRFHEGGHVGSEAETVDPVGDAEGLSLPVQLRRVLLVGPKQGVPDEERVDVGQGRQGLDQDVLSLPGGQAAEDAYRGGRSKPQFSTEVVHVRGRDGVVGRRVESIVHEGGRGSAPAGPKGAFCCLGVAEHEVGSPVGGHGGHPAVDPTEVFGGEQVVEAPDHWASGPPRGERPGEEGLLRIREHEVVLACELGQRSCGAQEGRHGPQARADPPVLPDAVERVRRCQDVSEHAPLRQGLDQRAVFEDRDGTVPTQKSRQVAQVELRPPEGRRVRDK